MTGISWGGYLTCIVAGVDNRFKAAVPVYGCGFLHENSAWLDRLAKMTPDQRDRWIELWDPSRYLPAVSMPILFVNGTNDFAYPLDSYMKSFDAVPGREANSRHRQHAARPSAGLGAGGNRPVRRRTPAGRQSPGDGGIAAPGGKGNGGHGRQPAEVDRCEFALDHRSRPYQQTGLAIASWKAWGQFGAGGRRSGRHLRPGF